MPEQKVKRVKRIDTTISKCCECPCFNGENWCNQGIHIFDCEEIDKDCTLPDAVEVIEKEEGVNESS
jgi:hypothetical protein